MEKSQIVTEVEFEQLLKDLPVNILEKAKEFKAFCRARKVQTPQQLLQIVFMYCGLDYSLRQVAANYTLLYEAITDSSIAERLHACGPWAKFMIAEMLQINNRQLRGKRIVILDASTVEAPGATGTDNKLHLAFDLVNLEFVQMKITDVHTGESFRNFSFEDGTIVMADRGYCDPNAIIEQEAKGIEAIVRYQTSIPLYDEQGKEIDLVAQLKLQMQQTTQTVTGFIQSKDGRKLEVHLHAYRLQEEQANTARMRIRKESHKKGHTPKDKTLFLAGWVLILTTSSPDEIEGKVIIELYRLRWQIELCFKRIKSVLHVDNLRARAGGHLGDIWLFGKMLYVLLVNHRSRRKFGDLLELIDTQRSVTAWRIWSLIQDEVRSLIAQVHLWRDDVENELMKAISERPRRRKLQTLPQPVSSLLLN